MDTNQLVEFIRSVTGDPAPCTDFPSAIQDIYSKLGFNAHTSRENSKALQVACKSRRGNRRTLPSNDFFWSALLPWSESPESALAIFEGNLGDRDRVEEIAVKTTELIESKGVPLAWALNVLPRPSDGEELRRFTGQDIVAQLCLQLLKYNSRLHQQKTLERCLEKCEAATTELEWFEVLAYFIAGLDEVYIIIDLDVLGRGTSNTASWPTALESMYRGPTTNKIHCIVKGLLFTCNATASFGPSSDINVIRIPRGNNMTLYSAGQSRFRYSNGPSDSMNSIELWLQHVGRQRPKRPRYPATSEDSHESEVGGDTMDTTNPKRRKRPCTWTDYWETEFDACIDASRKDEGPRVKIAILDTGADLSHPDIAEADKNDRVKYHDFITDKPTMVDADGHGTHCTSLLLKFAPNAEVYVARVFKKSHSSDTRPMIRAIKDAYAKWKVDIISISLGFSNPSQEMEDEIARAAAERVLVFASAANNTIHEQQPIRFPANMSQVFCIFSANAEGRPSTFNPEPKLGRPNLMFPGENIRGAWPASRVEGVPDVVSEGGRTYRPLSGTSCATPIAAAVAAGVLEYIWQPRQEPIERVERFKTADNMQRVFLEMAGDRKLGDREFYYVRPWYLISTQIKKQRIPSVLEHIVRNR
ncbi:hypothetical protein AUP68_12408 [Ilyonectria robusta]